MTWVRLDDGFIRHRKIRQLSHRAIVLHIAGLCHCNAQMTDGRIEKPDVPMLLADARVTRAVLAELVTHGCWHDHGDHFVIHDYLLYQESREKILDRREKWAKKKDAQRKSPGDTAGDSPGDTSGESQGVSHAPIPSHPIPSTSSTRTTHHHPDGSPDDDDGRFASVLDHLVDERIRRWPARSNKLAHRTKVTDSLLVEHGDTIRRFLAERPDHDAVVCAAALWVMIS